MSSAVTCETACVPAERGGSPRASVLVQRQLPPRISSRRLSMSGGSRIAAIALVSAATLAMAGTIEPQDRKPAVPAAEQGTETKQSTTGPFPWVKGDHICIIGNTLAERMQQDGWLETFLYARNPQLDFTIRNLGFSGDEINLRLRSQDFGTPDEWLAGDAPIPKPELVADRSVVLSNRFEKTNTKADVILAFFGYNESFGGEAGLPRFKDDLGRWIKHTLAQKYNGRTAPRLVVFSPIAFEDHKSPNLPKGLDINKNLERYTDAMSEVAKAAGVLFVDLYRPTWQAFRVAKKPLTINGIHLTENGNRKLAEIIDAALHPRRGPYFLPPDPILAALRPAVRDKAFHWYQRYRVTDGYSTYGGRAWLKFVGGQTNYEVVQKELEALDTMTANRDRVIWDVARGKEAKPDDSNLPGFVPVTTNKPGKGPDGTHLFLSGEDA